MTHIGKLIIKASLNSGSNSRTNDAKNINPTHLENRLEEVHQQISEEIDRKIFEYNKKSKKR